VSSVVPGSTAPQQVGPPREVWADVAKAACILLVVVHHVATKEQAILPGFAESPATHWWDRLSDLMTPIRMPLFFVVSGFFATRAVTRSWSSVLRPRVWNNFYLHVLWLLVAVLVHRTVGSLTQNRTESASDVLLAAVTAFTGLWYMYGLAVYFLVAKVWLRFAPGWSLVGAGALLALASNLGLLPERGNTDAIVENAVWFFAGIVGADLIRRTALRPRPLLAAGTLLAFGSLDWWLLRVDLGGTEAVLQIVLRALAVVAGVLTAVCVQFLLPRLAGRVAVLGRQTLPIYVMHGLLLICVDRVLQSVLAGAGVPPLVVALAFTPVVSVVLVAACLGLHRLLLRVGARWLFALPSFGRRGVAALPVQRDVRSLEVPTEPTPR
jgi:threonine dehydratase